MFKNYIGMFVEIYSIYSNNFDMWSISLNIFHKSVDCKETDTEYVGTSGDTEYARKNVDIQ